MKTIFLDRDGVLNHRIKGGYVRTADKFVWEKGARTALRQLTQGGFQIIVVTNQDGIGKGLMTFDDLERIHVKMKKEAQEAGGFITDVYYCPHTAQEGCACRKPRPGMLVQAALDYGIDLTSAVFVGDSITDVMAGKAARTKTVLIAGCSQVCDTVRHGTVAATGLSTAQTGDPGANAAWSGMSSCPDGVAASLFEAAQTILKGEI